MKANPHIYLKDTKKYAKRRNYIIYAYYAWEDDKIVLCKIPRISYRALIYLIQHEMYHVILHRLHLFKAQHDFDNINKRTFAFMEESK